MRGRPERGREAGLAQEPTAVRAPLTAVQLEAKGTPCVVANEIPMAFSLSQHSSFSLGIWSIQLSALSISKPPCLSKKHLCVRKRAGKWHWIKMPLNEPAGAWAPPLHELASPLGRHRSRSKVLVFSLLPSTAAVITKLRENIV